MNKNLLTYNQLIAVDVDPQNDFCPGGSLAVAEGDQVMAPLNTMNDYVYSHGGTVVVTGDQHPQTTPHFDKWPVHCVAGTKGAAFHQNLVIKPGYKLIDKGMGNEDGYSGFEGITRDGVTLEQFVTPRNPNDRTALLMGGLALDYCLRATVLDALAIASQIREAQRGVMDIFVLTDATRAVNLQPGEGQHALDEMQAAGATLITTADLMETRS